MPACGQCDKENPEGTVFCGYCGSALSSAPLPLSSALGHGDPPAHKPLREIKASPSKAPRPEFRPPPIPPPPPAKGRGKIEFIPWSQLSSAQRIGRMGALIVMFFALYFGVRFILSGVHGAGAKIAGTPGAQISEPALTAADRKDGIVSLCKVFQIYGIPTSNYDASEAAKNAAELFKLAGNQSHDRSAVILNTLAREFQAGNLKAADCAQAGEPLPSADNSDSGSAPVR